MKKYIIQVAIISVVLGLGSCKKKLELRPTDTIDITKAFTNVTELEKGLLGIYALNSYTNKIYMSSLLSDELRISDENRGQGQFTFKYQFSAGESEHNTAWYQYYFAIDRAHRVLSAIDNVPTANTAEVDKKKRIRAELTALRGIAYYELIIRFMPAGYNASAAGVPVVLKSDVTGQPARNTVGQVISQIEADLATARAELQIPNAPTDVLRLSQATIAGYQARVAMLKKDWPNAITFASSAITLSAKNVATGTSFASYWQDANENETLLKFRNSAAPQLLFRDNNGDVFFEPSVKLKNMYNRTTDIRFSVFFGSAGNDTSIVTKYPGNVFGPQINDLKIMRISDIYLLRAEAYAENNQLALAAADVTRIRNARITGNTASTYPTQADAITAILDERFRELAFEGDRFFTLKRRNLPVNRNAVDVQSTLWQNLAVGDYRWAMPIPQEEIFANKNPGMTQNPGY